MNVPPYCSFPAPADVGTIEVVTSTSESAQVAPTVDGLADGIPDSVGGASVEGTGAEAADVGVSVEVDGLAAMNGSDDVDGAGASDAPELRDGPAPDGFDPHAYTISRITISNPPSTIARRRQ